MKRIETRLRGLRWPFVKFWLRNKPHYHCPICHYSGPFMDKAARQHARCPRCSEVERGRLQWLVVQSLFQRCDPAQLDILHFAPEVTLREKFAASFRRYVSADLYRTDVDHNFDVQHIPFESGSFDVVYGSHILEYPEDDARAIAEIRRVLRPGGFAVLPVPLVHQTTVDLPRRDPLSRMYHEPGLDYFDRYRQHFATVHEYTSHMFERRYQPYIFTHRPDSPCNLEQEPGLLYDVVPVCYVDPQPPLQHDPATP